MPASSLQSKLDAAWSNIEKLVNGVIGEQKDRAEAALFDIRTVDAASRVILDVEGKTTPGEGVETTTFTATMFNLTHRRYMLRCTEVDLEAIAEGDASKESATITAWAKQTVASDVKVLLGPILTAGSNVTPGPVGVDAVKAARGALPQTGPTDPLVLVVADDVTLDDDTKKALRDAHCGDTVVVPAPSKTLGVSGVVLDAERLEKQLAVVEAMHLELDWHPDDDTAVLTLDCRRSDAPTPDASLFVLISTT